MAGYPSLHPSGFIEYEKDRCSGPVLYRDQPSREVPGITELNAVVQKYGVGQYTGGGILRLANNLKNTSRMWDRLPREGKKDFLKLLVDSDTSMSRDIIDEHVKKSKSVKFSDTVEYFGEKTCNCSENTDTKRNDKMSILVIVVVSIVAIIIGYLLACMGT